MGFNVKKKETEGVPKNFVGYSRQRTIASRRCSMFHLATRSSIWVGKSVENEQVNLHPMHLALTVVKLPLLWEHLGRCGRVLALLRDDLMRPRSGRGPDEVLALKFHHLHFVATQLERLKKQQPQLNAADVVARLANRLLKPGESSGSVSSRFRRFFFIHFLFSLISIQPK